MRLYVKQKVFSWTDKFTVKDEQGRDRYYVEGELFSLSKKLHIYNMQGEEVAMIKQKLFSLLHRFFVNVGGEQVAEIVKELTLFKHKYRIDGLGWEVNGDFWAHDYEILCRAQPVVTIHKQWMTWGDCYELDIANPADEINALAVVLSIDCVMQAEAAAAASSGSN